MPFVSFANTALVELVFNSNLVVCENTLYIRGTAPWTGSMLNVLAEEVSEWWITEIRGLVNNQTALTEVKARDMSTQFGAYGQFTPVAGNVGTGTSPAMPNNVTCAVKFTTGLAGRRNRGRNYFIGLQEAQCAFNLIDSAFALALAENYSDLALYLSVNDGVHVIASRATATAPDWTGVTTPVTGYSVDLGVDTQRRRLT